MKGRKNVLVLICSAQSSVQKAVTTQLENLGIDFLVIDEYIFSQRKNEILKCVELLDDEESAGVYVEVVESRLMGRLPSQKILNRDQYFALAEFCTPSEKEVFVDCGAFVGDTIEKYIFNHDGTFENIFAFEPDISNFKALEMRIERLNKEWLLSPDKIQIINAGVGFKTMEGSMDRCKRAGSAISERSDPLGDPIKIFSLDDFFFNQRINFLKADIESFELDMLKGAEKIIRRDLPKIAVCIYHNASDMYQILLWLNNLNLGYRFSVRHHRVDHFETVLYAYV